MRHLKTLAAVLCIAATLILAGGAAITLTRNGGAPRARRATSASPLVRQAQGSNGLGTTSGLPPLALALAHDIDHAP